MYKNILVALELAGNEDYLIEAALKHASAATSIRFLHAFEAPVYPADSYLGDLPLRVRDEQVTRAKSQFSELAKKFSLSSEHHIVVVGRAAGEIHHAAKESNADLIVVGSHGRHGIGLLLGSTANAVLHGASCDVLAVRMREDT